MPIAPAERTVALYKSELQLVSTRHQTILGEDVGPGDKLPMKDLGIGVGMRLWLTGRAEYEADYRPTPEVPGAEGEEDRAWLDPADGVTVETGDNGWYTIHATWLDPAGEKVRGSEAAKARVTSLRETGDTKGVEYAATGGGWFQITAPWLTEPEKVQGEEATKKRVTELREAGAPSGSGEGGGGSPAGA